MPFIDVPDGDGDNTARLFSRRPEVYAAWGQLEPLTVGPPIETP